MALTIDGSTVAWAAPGSRPQDPPLTLWGIGTTRTFRAHWMLAELGLSYVSRRIQSRTGETFAPDFLRLNPRHKIPVLQHGDLVIAESAAIIQYLAEQFPAPPSLFIPADAPMRAKLNEWCYFIMSELDGHTLYVIRRHVGLKHLYGEAPTAVAAAKLYFREQIEALQPQFDGTGAYLFGDRLSVADILLTSCLDWAAIVDIALPPATQAYRARVTARPAYHAAKRRNDPAIHPAACAGAGAVTMELGSL